ncbi:MAG: hypothetical protein ACLQRH_15335 [Acidimicrobiales bacterium]
MADYPVLIPGPDGSRHIRLPDGTNRLATMREVVEYSTERAAQPLPGNKAHRRKTPRRSGHRGR